MEEKIIATISKIKHYNNTTGFGAVLVKIDFSEEESKLFKNMLFSNTLTVVGVFSREPMLHEEYKFSGEFETNQYGYQFKMKSYEIKNVASEDFIITYLSSDFFPGIGKGTAKKVYDTLGSDCIKKIVDNKAILETIPGITDKQKETLYENIVSNDQYQKAILELLGFGISVAWSKRLNESLGENAASIIRENPYLLIDLVDGIGFKRADEIALKNDIKKDSPLRVKSFILYLINLAIRNKGDTYLEKETLQKFILTEINKDEVIVDQDKLNSSLKELEKEKKIIIIRNKIFEASLDKAEKTIAQRVFELLQERLEVTSEDVREALEKQKEDIQFEYNYKQNKAIVKALSEKLTIITGGPGTGKSTIIQGIIKTYLELNKDDKDIANKIALIAPTGRASQRLKEVTGFNAMTVHRFLGYEGGNRFRYSSSEPVFASLVIVDEFSMVDTVLAAKLFESVTRNACFVLVGDSNQLPSVGSGQVLADLISSKEITITHLDEIHRQASDSSIVSLAHCINNGNLPESILESKEDSAFFTASDENIIPNIISIIEKAIEKDYNLINNIQVLVPFYKGDIGINSLNDKLQERFNPSVDKQEIKHYSRRFRVNDKVIQLANRTEKKVMNGDIGFIYRLIKEDGSFKGLEVNFDNNIVAYKIDELDDIMHAYAISIHKAQGSEFDLVIIPFSFKYYNMLKRKLIYTAITRAKKSLVMIGDIKAFHMGIKGVEESRKTALLEKLQNAFSNNQSTSKENSGLSPFDFL